MSVADTTHVLHSIESYGDNPSAYLALNDGNRYFATSGVPGIVAYREAGRYLIQFGGPFTEADAMPDLLRAFTEYAARRNRRVLAVQLQERDAALYAGTGFRVNQMGASYALELARYTLKGTKFMRLRNKISRAKRSGVVVEETDPGVLESTLDAVDRAWLRAKGRHVKPLRFLVGEHGAGAGGRRRLFVARTGGETVAYITYVPVYGSRPGWLHDLSRRHTGTVPPGVMEMLNATAIERFSAEGAGWLHFGFTPFTGLDPAYEMGTASGTVGRIVRFLAKRGEAVYPSRTQLAYKEKWGPHAVLPEYIAFQGRPRLGAIWQLMRTTNAV